MAERTGRRADVPLTAWLDEHVPSLGDGPLETAMIHGGTSNVILSLCRGDETLVLRRPPAVPPPNSEKSIMREARVLDGAQRHRACRTRTVTASARTRR